jgi:hypothetical protein
LQTHYTLCPITNGNDEGKLVIGVGNANTVAVWRLMIAAGFNPRGFADSYPEIKKRHVGYATWRLERKTG